MAIDLDKRPYECLETFRELLFNQNRDIAEKLTYGAPMLQTMGEVLAILGIPVDLTLREGELIAFVWDLCEILQRRGAIMILGGEEKIEDTIKELHNELTSEVLREYATGIIVTQDEIVVADAADDEMAGKSEHTKQIELLPETKQKADRRLH